MKPNRANKHNTRRPAYRSRFSQVLVWAVLTALPILLHTPDAMADATFTVTPTSGSVPLAVTAFWDPVDCICDYVEIIWGDGDSTGMMFGFSGSIDHTYTSAGTYTVQATCAGDNPSLSCNPQRTVTVSGG
ncbi:MAG: PKD domain-containing protein, partial [Desulfobacterales bacterium]|nr:PKD domain-containing protein [Desulfobacterales bacterium]